MSHHRRLVGCDFGGGTFDVTAVAQDGRRSPPIATGGDALLGGDDLHIAMANAIAGLIFRRAKFDALKDHVRPERISTTPLAGVAVAMGATLVAGALQQIARHPGARYGAGPERPAGAAARGRRDPDRPRLSVDASATPHPALHLPVVSPRRSVLVLVLAACRSAPVERTVAPEARPAVASAGTDAGAASCVLAGPSPCISAAPVSVKHGVLAWSEELAGRDASATECRWVVELPDVLLCGTPGIDTINRMLTRAAVYIEAAGQKGVVISHDSDVYRGFVAAVGGFDLLKDHPDPKRADLIAYYAALDAACARTRALCDDPGEAAMRQLITRAWEGKPRFVLITFPHRGPVSDEDVVSHEILHAQLFTDAIYARVVETYWRDLDVWEKKKVRTELARAGYDPNDDFLMANELQAYVLMAGAESNRMASFVPKHRTALLAELRAAGREPLQTERR